jgi:Ran GTPase-activating protein (RanGAP) involved in mRNA processing and transport/adenylate kinase family enzyme
MLFVGVAVMRHYSDQDVGNKIEELEAQFMNLHTSILDELKESKVLDIQSVLHALTLLPIKLRNEYQELISDKLPMLRSEKTISELLLHLNPLLSFVDYSLLEHIINRFGSTSLKDRMKSYCHEIQNFMSQTTVQHLIDYWPRKKEISPDISEMIATIKRDPQNCSLVELDAIRRNMCIQARLSDVICAVVSVKNSRSFIVIWGMPSVLAPDMIKSLELADDGFYSKNDIHSLSVGNKLVYSPLTTFSNKLRKRYQTATQTTVFHAEWTTLPTSQIFKLAMIQRERLQHGQIDDPFVKMTISGKVDDILHSKTPVELRNIFKSDKDEERQILLIEGAPGSGKTTLTIFICQKWGKGELFQQFTAVILVQLRDPAVQRAQTIADLLPVENAEEIAAELIATNGRGVLWVLDGWDELPPHLQQQSIFCKLLPPKPSEQKRAEIKKDPVYSEYVLGSIPHLQQQSEHLPPNPRKQKLAEIEKDPVYSKCSIPHLQQQSELLPPNPRKQKLAEIEKDPVYSEYELGSKPHLQQQSKLLPPKPSEQKLADIEEDPVYYSEYELGSKSHLQQQSIFHKFLPPKPSEEKLAEIQQHPLYHKYADEEDSEESLWITYRENRKRKLLEAEIEKDPVSRTQYYKNRLLNEASIVVTSRPISSGDLHPVVSSRIEVLGFTPEEQRQYFTECLKGDTKALEALLEKIQENPVVQSSCYLPLNAAFIVHTFKYRDQSLPNTEYEIYLSVILSCIQRHYDREGRGHDLPRELASLDDLSRSEAVREPFQCLCELAYRGVMENKVTFSSSDLPQGSNTLGLLHAIESFLQSGKSVFYSFIHLSFKELLAGYYIATSLSDSEQVSQFHQLFHQPRFVGVFQFYAAITKLKTPGMDKIISEIVSKKSKPHLLSLLRCLYEVQDPSLCQYVVNQLGGINVSYSSLSPMDLLSIGYLIGMSTTNVVKVVSLFKCHIGDYDIKTLVKYLVCSKGAGTWTFNLSVNHIGKEGAANIAKVLQSSNVINSLLLLDNPIGAGGLQSLAEALITNTSLVELNLYRCSLEITDENGPIITEMLHRNKTLRTLDLAGANNNISDTGVIYIAKGLERNTALKCLRMDGISAVGSKALASTIATNASLPLLELKLDGCDMITEDSKQAFIDMLQQNTSIKILELRLSSSVSDPVPFLAEALQNNSTLKRLRLFNYILTPDMVKDVSRILAVNRSLISLNISGNPIGDAGVTHLAEALKQNKTLEKLDISASRITDAGVALEALKQKKTLEELDISTYCITDVGVTPLPEGLKRNNSLEELDIIYCHITDAGVAPLAEALKQNRTLRRLDISHCCITDAGVAPLAEALEVNHSLHMLKIWGNNLTENGQKKLELAAKKSYCHVSS